MCFKFLSILVQNEKVKLATAQQEELEYLHLVLVLLVEKYKENANLGKTFLARLQNIDLAFDPTFPASQSAISPSFMTEPAADATIGSRSKSQKLFEKAGSQVSEDPLSFLSKADLVMRCNGLRDQIQ